MNERAMARYDLVTSVVFLVIGVYMTIEGLKLPGAGGFIEKGGEPGRVVIMLGLILALFALVLMVRSVVQGGHRGWRDRQGEPGSGALLRGTVTALGCSFYAVGLLGSTIAGWEVPYYLATALFVFIFIVLSEWSAAPELGAGRWKWLGNKAPGLAGALESRLGFIGADRAPLVWLFVTAALQAVLVTWAVTYLFEQEFYVKLP